MRNKFRKILLVFVIMFSFIINANAETKIIEDTSKYEGDVYIIGSSKFDSDIIITGTMASKAGAREAYIQYFINENLNFNVDALRIYYYCGLDGKWSLLPATEDDQFRDLTEEEVKELTEELRIYYVNEKEKILEIPYDSDLKDGYELVFGVDDPSKLSDVKYDEGKIFVPATVKKLSVFAKDSNNQHMILDTFEQVNTEFEIKNAVVTTLEELKDAISSEKEEIRLGNDIIGINETIKIPYSVIFRGAGYKLAFENIEKVGGTASGLVISGEGSVVENLTIEMDDKVGWQGNYGLQVYNANGVNVTNYKGTKADAALLVNASNIMLQGNIDVSGNEFGGIEVSKGTAEGLENSSLHVNGNIVMEDESIRKPAVWLENEQGFVVLHEGYNLVQNFDIPQVLGKSQIFYYTSDSVYENVEVTSADELLLAAALTDVESIKLASDIDLETAVEITNKLTIDLNGHNLTVKNDTEGNGVFYVREGGDLTINGDGTIDGVGNNIYNIAIFADGGKVTLNGGTYTNVNTVVNPEDSDSEHYDLIYAKGTAQIVINGGRYEGKTPAWLLNLKDNARETSSITVYGGTFVGFNPADNKAEGEGTSFVAEGYKVVQKNGEYTVSEANGEVVALGNSLQDVINNSEAGSIISITKDMDLPTAVEVTKKVIIELNGHNLTVKSDTEGNGVFYVREGGDLTINGEGTIDGVGNNIYNIAIFADGGKVTLNGGTYTNVNTVVNPEDSDSEHYDLIYAKGTAQIVINGGRYEGKTPAWLLNLKDNARETSSITVYGGTFVGFNPADNKAEGDETNFVAEGYKVVESNSEYTVVVNE